jgi:ribosomal protein S18 acetylase RimI-like enzyme
VLKVAPLVDGAPIAERLARILTEVVAAGGSVHFIDPIPPGAALEYWRKALAGATSGDRIVFGGFVDGALEGTVSLFLDTPPNQSFRAEIWKLMVAPGARGRGLARALMLAAQDEALRLGRTLLNLDTAADGGASELYESPGWIRVGVIPDYAHKPHGALVGTAIYCKRLAPAQPLKSRGEAVD